MPEILTRRSLPHWYQPGASFFVTYRLAGTLPAQKLDSLKASHKELSKRKASQGETALQHRIRMHKQWFAAYDALLDSTADIATLADPRIASIVRGNLHHHHGTKLRLLAYCIMPNHVHLVIQPVEIQDVFQEDQVTIGERDDSLSPLSKIMHSLKSYTAHEANKVLNRSGAFWQRESYDHWIRDEEELDRILTYIEFNPVKAGLVLRPEDWFWCSCHDRFLRDGEATAWLNLV